MSVSIPDCLAISFAAGFFFGILYEILRTTRLLLRATVVVLVCDIAFFAAAAFAVMILSENLGNYIRIYTIIGFAAGIFSYITTVGRLFNFLERKITAFFRRIIGKIARKTGIFVGKFTHQAKVEFVKITKNTREFSKNKINGLNSRRKMMYNKKRLNGLGKIGEGKNNVIKADVKRSS